MYHKALLIISTLFIFGCATPYQSSGLSGGYYDEKLPTDEYRVGFGGNGYTNLTTAVDFAMLRCAELTLTNGKKYFEVVSGGGGELDDAYWTGYAVAYSSKPNAEYIIRLHDTEPEQPDGKVFNAK